MSIYSPLYTGSRFSLKASNPVSKNMTFTTEMKRKADSQAPLMSWDRSIKLQLELLTGKKRVCFATTVEKLDTSRVNASQTPELPKQAAMSQKGGNARRKPSYVVKSKTDSAKQGKSAMGKGLVYLCRPRPKGETACLTQTTSGLSLTKD
jgi:hypothetical protein